MHKLASLAAALSMLSGLADGQTIEFTLRTFPDSPVVFADSAPAAAPGVPRRQFVTIRNESKKSVAAVIFEESVAGGSKNAIVAMERVGILVQPGEKKRLSVAVEDMVQKLQTGEPPGRPVLSIVAVEFLDGLQWNAPTGSEAGAR
jgi:hypothetical protein